MVSETTLINDWEISEEEIANLVEQMAEDAELNEKDAIEKSRRRAIHRIARTKIDKLINQQKKEIRILENIPRAMFLIAFVLWEIFTGYLILKYTDPTLAPGFLIIGSVFGIIVIAIGAFKLSKLIILTLVRKKYRWMYGGGLYTDSVGLYYDEQMPVS